MHLRYKLAKVVGHLPYFFFKTRLVKLIYHPDKVFKKKYANVIKTYNLYNTKFLCNSNSLIEWGILVFGGLERGLLNYFLFKINEKKPDLFIDIGANVGFFSLPISKIIRTISFEPFSINFNKLTENLKLNRIKQIDIYNYALSDKNTEGNIYLKKNQPNFGEATISNRKHKFDSLYQKVLLKIFDQEFNLFNKYLMIKIDVEGHELKTLLGMQQTLIKNKCLIYVETIDSNVLLFFKKNGYKFKFIKKDLQKKIKFSDKNYGHVIFKNF